MNKSIVLPLAIAASMVASLAGPVLSIQTVSATGVDACGETFVYTKTGDFSDSRVLINFESSDKQIDVSAQSGYAVTKVELDVDDDGHLGYHTYATGSVNNFNPNPGNDINTARVTVKKTCPDVCPNIADDQYIVPEGMVIEEGQCVIPPIDVCPNLPGNQETLPEGYEFVGESCELIPPPPVDVCPNIPDNQETMPEGYELVGENCELIPPPVVDVCPNLPGDQETMPEGYELVGESCVEIAPEPVDVCPNIPDNQETLPEGYEFVGENCEVIPPPVEVDPTGSITVCKVIADVLGNLVTASSETDVPSGSFTVSGFTPSETSEAAPVGVIGSAGFVTPLTWNTNLFGDDVVLDAQCIGFSGLTLGGYYYDQEVVSPNDSTWLTPKYNDQFTVSVNDVSDAYVYDTNLFDGNAENDESREANADGHIVLSAERPNRTLVVVNQFTEPGVCEVSSHEVREISRTDTEITYGITTEFTNCGEGTLVVEGFDPVTTESGVEYEFTLPRGGTTTDVPYDWDAGDAHREGTLYVPAAPGGGDNGGGEENGVENTEELCTDELDNDDDGDTDAEDTDCAPFQGGDNGGGSEQQTPPPSGGGGQYLEEGAYRCTNGIDDDGNGLTDAADPKCAPSGSSQSAASGETAPQGEVLGATTCEALLTDYLRMGKKNDPEQVKKLQQFLNDHMQAGLEVTGFFGKLTHEAVKQFQLKYWDEILTPWVPHGFPNDKEPSGYVYKTTLRKINNLFCDSLQLPIPQLP